MEVGQYSYDNRTFIKCTQFSFTAYYMTEASVTYFLSDSSIPITILNEPGLIFLVVLFKWVINIQQSLVKWTSYHGALNDFITCLTELKTRMSLSRYIWGSKTKVQTHNCKEEDQNHLFKSSTQKIKIRHCSKNIWKSELFFSSHFSQFSISRAKCEISRISFIMIM